jgi:kojibiose phosphorylase
MPFYLFTLPKMAENMLRYRFRRLGAARKIALANGYKGAQFAWESAGSGADETPEWARDIDRTIIKIHTHKMEHHITADIAYALYRYYVATGDKEFMEHCGYEMLIETARFWASRLTFNRRKKRFEIRHVIGPDEFHVDVNNNAFTNIMAKWNLITSARLISNVNKKSLVYKRLKKKLSLSNAEIQQWARSASKIGINMNRKKLIEQFDGYFKLKKVNLNRTDENGIYLLPRTLKAKDLKKTQLIKQADVLMLFLLLNDVFSAETKRANYEFYSSRTVHRSSLSAPMQAFIACEVGDLHRAYSFFNVALRTDISNLYGNTPEGIHAAALGGTWQTLIFGFAGVTIRKETLCIDPRMPLGWRRLIFQLAWRQSTIALELTNETVKIKIISSKLKEMVIGVFSRRITLKTNKVYTFQRYAGLRKKEEYYL